MKQFRLLSAIQDYLIKTPEISENSEHVSKGSYEYRCSRCGLVLEFNRNQPSAKCPNDGSNMMRII